MGQDARQIADSLAIPEIKAGARQLPMPSASGAQIKLLGADYEELINSKGKIAPVISDTPVNVSFKVTKGGQEAVSKDYEITLKAPAAAQGNPKPRVIPEILQWKGGKGEYKLGSTITVACPDKELPVPLPLTWKTCWAARSGSFPPEVRRTSPSPCSRKAT